MPVIIPIAWHISECILRGWHEHGQVERGRRWREIDGVKLHLDVFEVRFARSVSKQPDVHHRFGLLVETCERTVPRTRPDSRRASRGTSANVASVARPAP